MWLRPGAQRGAGAARALAQCACDTHSTRKSKGVQELKSASGMDFLFIGVSRVILRSRDKPVIGVSPRQPGLLGQEDTPRAPNTTGGSVARGGFMWTIRARPGSRCTHRGQVRVQFREALCEPPVTQRGTKWKSHICLILLNTVLPTSMAQWLSTEH